MYICRYNRLQTYYFIKHKQSSISSNLCRAAWISKTYLNYDVRKIQPNLWSTNNTLSIEDTWWCYDRCFETENIIIETGLISTFHGKGLLSNLGDVSACILQTGECVKLSYVIIWSATSLAKYSHFEKTGTYNATISQHFMTIEAVQGAFTLIEETKMCNQTFVSTKQNV